MADPVQTELAVEPQEPQKPAPAATPAPEGGEQAQAQPQGEEQKPPEPERTFSQKELDEILERRLAKERSKREKIAQERDTLMRLAREANQRREPAPEPKAPTGGEPTRDQYESYEAFIEARAEYRANQAVETRLKAEREAANRERQAKEEQERRDSFQKRLRENAKGLDDFFDVLAEATASEDSPVGRLHPDAIENSDAPAKLLYHLSQNPDEAERIASLPVGKQAREIWKLERQLAEAPAPRKPSAAPAPIKPVGGKSAAAEEMPDAAKDPDKWLEWRTRQLAAAKGARSH